MKMNQLGYSKNEGRDMSALESLLFSRAIEEKFAKVIEERFFDNKGRAICAFFNGSQDGWNRNGRTDKQIKQEFLQFLEDEARCLEAYGEYEE